MKTLSGISPWVQLNNNYYLENNTKVWWFDSDTMEVVVMEIQDSGGSTVTTVSCYELELQRGVGNTEGTFKLIKSKIQQK
ncbi:hypothetical protein SAMN02745150_01111 [Brevinema andersonii]|uniref:Uncharacterized protein n=1 Tax=Brevinema andersonii TaxID=34097 RepID=A0A1I1EHJ8_BREAD|nr:hypothetical protein [Brevinema andersonii]SFB86541.1 hypothetical protein SAMN02745150_01111 [Brevinema andersonii]